MYARYTRRAGSMRASFLVAAAWSFLAGTAVAQVPFVRAVIDPGFHGDCKALGDFDGDGLLDVAVGGRELRWYRYPTWAPTVIAVPAVEFTTDMQAADVDGDGDLDLVVPDLNPGDNLLWFENPRPGGDPATTPWPRHAIGAFGWAHDVEVGDIDGDTRLDVVTRQGGTTLWLQTAADVWTRIDLAVAAPGGEGVALGDIDRDGDLDLALNGYWLESPPDPRVAAAWTKRDIVAGWPDLCGVRIADVDRDGRDDVILAASESTGRLAWFQGPPDPRAVGAWNETVIDPSVDYVHTFQVVDVDRNGLLDVVFAEMAQAAQKRVGVFYNLGGAPWNLQVLSMTGSHNIRTGDLGGDGDVDIMGANWQGAPVEWWESQLPPCSLDDWTYVEVDAARGAWGDWDTPSWAKYFGLAMGDLTGDGRGDIVSGRYFYRNPGGDLTAAWTRVDLGLNCDASAVVEVDGDALGDIIASAGDRVYWLEAVDAAGGAWTPTVIDAAFPKPGHGNPQGYALADVVPGGRPEVLLIGDAAGDLISYQIPPNPAAGAWPRTTIVTATNGEGIGVGDIDRDGIVDVVVAHEPPGWSPGDLRFIKWARNPGDGSGAWNTIFIGEVDGDYPDRVAVGDLNGDGRVDVVVTEEEQAVTATAKTYWFEAPADPITGTWIRHTLAQQYTTNSLDLHDIDGDGDLDVILAEDRGDQKLAIWDNDGVGNFIERVVDTGKESHLGARVADLDGDGDAEIVSIAWDQHQFLHLWRNDNCAIVNPRNRAPTVYAGADASLLWPARATNLAGVVSDDGLPAPAAVTVAWTLVSGPGNAVFADASAPATTVVFDRIGDYVLRLAADDGVLASFDELTVRVLPFASDLILHWTLDDGVGAAATDSTSWSNHGTVTGPAWTAGVIGGGLDFDGVDDYAQRASAALGGPFPATPAATGAFTVAAWIRLDRVGARNPIAGKQGNGERGFLFMTEDDDRLTLELFKDATANNSVRSNATMIAGRNYHVAATYEFRGDGASAVRLYIDGALDGGMDTAVGPLNVNATAFEVGRYWWSSSYSVYLDGLLDDVRVYSRALSGCELGRVSNGGFDTDNDGLPDAWEVDRIGGLGQGPMEDSDGDGVSHVEEYAAGTDPADAASRVILYATKTALSDVTLRFDTTRANGPGYECETRVYDVTRAPDVLAGPWIPASPCSDLAATGAPADCTVTGLGPSEYLRVAPRLVR